jgi:hypothetical protein
MVTLHDHEGHELAAWYTARGYIVERMGSVIIPDADEISKFNKAACCRLAKELLDETFIYEPIDGFAAMDTTTKRSALIRVASSFHQARPGVRAVRSTRPRQSAPDEQPDDFRVIGSKQRDRRAASTRNKNTFRLLLADLLRQADVLLSAEPGGWVRIAANTHGRDCLKQAFPNANIKWDNLRDSAPDWQGSRLGYRTLRFCTDPPIRELITGDLPLDEERCTRLALCVGWALPRHGARAAALIEDCNSWTVFEPESNHHTRLLLRQEFDPARP